MRMEPDLAMICTRISKNVVEIIKFDEHEVKNIETGGVDWIVFKLNTQIFLYPLPNDLKKIPVLIPEDYRFMPKKDSKDYCII